MAYKHGIYTKKTSTAMPAETVSNMVQVVIGTAPVYMAENPGAAVNTPILCGDIEECRKKLGYSGNFEKYTLCQSMYMNFEVLKTDPIVFINVLDPSRHKISVESKTMAVSNKTVKIEDEVIISSLSLKNGSSEIAKDKYITEWVDGSLVITISDETVGESVTVAYDKVDASKVTADDIIGAYDTATEKRTGCEVIKTIYPKLGKIPCLLLAPGWTDDDTVGAVLSGQATEINGCFTAYALLDLDSSTDTTRAAAVTAKKSRTFNENVIMCYPRIKKDGHEFSLSALIAAIIMYKAKETGGVTCTSPSNTQVDIDECITGGGSVFYDTEDGNELNAEGIVTVISRNGWYIWGNNTAIYPQETDPAKRWIMAGLAINYIENSFIHNNFGTLDKALNPKFIEDCVTDENIRLASYAAAGYIIGGSIEYNPEDNTESDILAGHLTCRTSIASNIPGEAITNVFSFDTDALINTITGGGE